MHSFGFLIDWQIGIALLWLLYRLVLRGRIPFGGARVYLLLIAPVAATIAALKLPLLAPIVLHATQGVVETNAIPPTTTMMMVETPVNWVFLTYIIVSGLILTLFVVGAVRWVVKWRGGIACGGVRFCKQGRAVASSMFGLVAVDMQCLGSDALESIVAHERAHVTQRHTWDLLYISMLRIALWFNPVVWLLGKDLTLVHEAQADAAVLDSGFSPERYIHTLLDAEIGAIGGPIPGNFAPIHYFSFCSTKKRIEMMTKLFPSRRSMWRLAAVLPVLGGLLAVFSFTRPVVVVEPPQTHTPTEMTTRTAPAVVIVYQKSTYDGEQFVEFRRSVEGEPKLDPAKIASMSVLQGEHAVQYMNLDPASEAGKTVAAGGVVVIDMKGADPDKTKIVMSRVKDSEYMKPLTENFLKKIGHPASAQPTASKDTKAVEVAWLVNTPESTNSSSVKQVSEKLADQSTLVIISAKTKEGKEVPIGISGSMEGIDAETVESLIVVNGKSIVDIYWKEATPEVRAAVARDGLILLTLKETVDSDPAKRSFLARHLTEEQVPVAKAFLRTIEAQKVTYAK